MTQFNDVTIINTRELHEVDPMLNTLPIITGFLILLLFILISLIIRKHFYLFASLGILICIFSIGISFILTWQHPLAVGKEITIRTNNKRTLKEIHQKYNEVHKNEDGTYTITIRNKEE